jgi:hypothetical protein
MWHTVTRTNHLWRSLRGWVWIARKMLGRKPLNGASTFQLSMRFNHQVVWWSLMSYHKNLQDQAVKHQFLSIRDATWVPLDASCTFLYIFFPFCPKSPEEWSPSQWKWGTNGTPQSPSATPQRQKMISTSQMMFKTSTTELQGEISNFGGFVGWFPLPVPSFL